MAEAPAERFVTALEDSRRWRHVVRRPDDIIISTPPKCGTTWMQGIVRSLLWPDNAPPEGQGVSPWVDMRGTPIEQLVQILDEQEHRRFLKTHSPGDCVPFDSRCKYIVVYRDARDALVSWANHRANMRPEILEMLNAIAATDGVAPIATTWHGDFDDLFDEWSTSCSPVRHLASWWPRRHEPNVLFVHYADLSADLPTGMRRIAQFLDVELSNTAWPAVIERCTLEHMRTAAEASGRLDQNFVNGATSFFYKGGVGRWQNILSTDQAHRCMQLVTHGLSTEAADWLTFGSSAIGWAPSELGEPQGSPAMATAHPLARLKRNQASAVQAISERRLLDAREQGLFDDLPLAGKPIADIDQRRQPGWWAARFVKSEKAKVRAFELEEELRRAMPALWRSATAQHVVMQIARHNALVDEHNRRSPDSPVARLDEAKTVATWRRLGLAASDADD